MVHLSREGCLNRQDRVRRALRRQGLDALLVTEPAHVMYLTDYTCRSVYASAVFLPVEGPAVLSAATEDPDEVYADELIAYPSGHLGTLADDQLTAALTPLLPLAVGRKRIGCDAMSRPWLLSGPTLVDFNPVLAELRRAKDRDEVAMIAHAIRGCEAGYDAARQFIKPGLTEVQVYARFQAAAIEAVGEPIGEMGNDFRAGEPGGSPRVRFINAGELMPLDVSVVYRGYRCDLCRTLSVDRQPTDAQREAHRLVLEALAYVEAQAKVGTSCRQLYEDVRAMLDGKHGWSFPHHLGHGIGLRCHEAPRLNPHWDDVLAVGDVFTVEPGLYHASLGGGVRVEQNYLVTDTGLERLSNHDTSL